MHSKVRNIPRNTQLRGRLFDKWPRKGLSGACCGPSGEVSGAPTGRGPACSATRDGDGQGVLRWSRGGTSAFSGAGQGGAGGSAVEPGGGASVFSGAGRGRCRGFCGGAGAGPARSAARDRAVQVVLRWSPEAEPACSAARDRGGTGSSEVQTGRAGRREGGGAWPVDRRPAPSQRPLRGAKPTAAPPGRKKSVPKGRCARRQDAKKCSEGKVRRRPNTYGHKKNGPRSVHFYFCYTTLLLYGLLLRDARPIHPAARQRLRTPGARLFCGRLPAACSPATACLPSISVCPSVGVTAVKASAIRSLSRSAARRSGLSRLAAGISAVRVAPRESRSRSGRPRESLRPPPGSQFSAARVTVLSRPGSRPSAARNLPSLLLAPSAAGVTAPPRQYGRPPATGESPASSLRRASPARDSTAYRPAP